MFKSTIMFISGFFLALVIYNHPVDFNSNSLLIDSDQTTFSTLSNSKQITSNQDLNSKPLTSRSETGFFKGRSTLFNVSSSRASLNDIPNIDARIDDQIPTAPPTGRPEADGEEEAADEQTTGDSTTSELKQADINNKFDSEKLKYNRNDEKSSSSVLPLVGSVVSQVTQDLPKVKTQTGNNSGGITIGGGGNTLPDNTQSDVIPDEFTSAGLVIAKRLYSSSSISEVEYLEYLSLGLNSSDTTLSNSALNEIVALKTKASFLVLSQYANSSDMQSVDQSILNNYRSASDLRFLSQMIADDSSIEAQNLAVYSLDVIINGDTMNFQNQQVRDTLINNISPSLNRLSSGHPSYGLASRISSEINNNIFS